MIQRLKQGQQVHLAFDPEKALGTVGQTGADKSAQVTWRAQEDEKGKRTPRLRVWYDAFTASRILRTVS